MSSATPEPFTAAHSAQHYEGIPDRLLPDDTLVYLLFLLPSKEHPTNESLQSRLGEIRSSALALASDWFRGHIFQRSGFSLELTTISNHVCLSGSSEYGDCIDDCWFLSAAVRELSNRFPELWIRLYDTDGEFLLIEAANVLPRWLNPEIAENRVWINGGKMYLIPFASFGKRTQKSLELGEALDVIKGAGKEGLQRIRLVEEEAFYRMANYPAKAWASWHWASVKIPRTLVGVLQKRPESIAAGVEAFYLRDPVALNAVKRKKRIFAPGDEVKVPVKFTKTLYAQMKGQKWEPPVESGMKSVLLKDPEYNAVDVGNKLTAGFEMLLADENDIPKVTSESRKTAIKEIRELLQTQEPPTDAEIEAWEVEIDKKEGPDIDDEEWLDIDFEEFEQDLQDSKSKGPKVVGGYGDPHQEQKVKKLVEKFMAFMNDDEAGPEGAEFLDDMDMDDDEEDSDSESDDAEYDENVKRKMQGKPISRDDESSDSDADYEDLGEDKAVSFDEAQFESMMREMMKFPPQDAAASEPAPTTQESAYSELQKLQERMKNVDFAEKAEKYPEMQKLQSAMARLNVEDTEDFDQIWEEADSDCGKEDEDEDLDEYEAILTSQNEIEHELNAMGALNRESKSEGGDGNGPDTGEDRAVNIDYNLAKNMLESFKGQAGVPGPAGNMLARMGITLPRDEDGSEDEIDAEREMTESEKEKRRIEKGKMVAR